jgi:endonuclease/exonuclease/phosphatase family metal-dependent hydrolase
MVHPKRLLILLGVIVVAQCLSGCAGAIPNSNVSVTVGTFNVEWLGDGKDDKKPRTDADYLRIADIIIKTDADVMALQEVENEQALQKILRYTNGYSGFVALTEAPQNVAIIYRPTVQVSKVGVLESLVLIPGRLRPGLEVQCSKGSFDWRMVIVHLKASSRADSTAQMRVQARELRSKQVEILAAYADSLLANGKEQDILLVGDFNDYPGRQKDPTLNALSDNPNFTIPTAQLKNCSNPKWTTIDHVMVTTSAAKRLIPNSPRTEPFAEYLSAEEAKSVSDHCPVLVSFSTDAPDND